MANSWSYILSYCILCAGFHYYYSFCNIPLIQNHRRPFVSPRALLDFPVCSKFHVQRAVARAHSSADFINECVGGCGPPEFRAFILAFFQSWLRQQMNSSNGLQYLPTCRSVSVCDFVFFCASNLAYKQSGESIFYVCPLHHISHPCLIIATNNCSLGHWLASLIIDP